MIGRARTGAGGTVLGGDVLLRMRYTHKMATNTSGNAGRALSSLFDSLTEFICSKGSSSVGYRVDWCKNHRLQSNQFGDRRDEKEEEEKEKEKDGEIDRFPCITVAVYFSYFGSVIG